MKKTFYTSMLVAAVTTSSLGTANVLAAPIVEPKQVIPMKNVDIGQFSSSLRKLGEQAALLRAYALIIGNQPIISLPQIPVLQDVQQLIQSDISKEWLREIFNRRLVNLNEKNRAFVNVLHTYVEQGNMEGIQKKLNSRKIEQYEIQQDINELENFKSSLDKDRNSFTKHIQEADSFLNGGSGRITELKRDIQAINDDMKKDLDVISSVPGILVNAGTTIGSMIWKLLDPIAKGGTQEAIDHLVTLTKKLEEAKKEAIEEAKASDGNADIEKITKEVENNFAKSPEGLELVAASLKKYDFMDKIDIEQIKTIIETEAVGNAALQKQKDAILRLAETNNKLFTATRNLQAVDMQAIQILFIQSKIDMFTEQIDIEIDLLKKHQKDWIIIEQAITELPEKPTSSDLKILKELCKQLEVQIRGFTKITS
ncbi:HBL/NHE enterotoxin family protein [Bacillus sp. CDB3]|uniref:HBL/NHE enterotoxin family protein n=1 Tax=Bacillus sp. CDB3 TaxID=360310 RepID=UPI0009D87028|nr:HBL/NHE enterotoxin family protein [Bacillus sp. CDB3]OQR53357.1 hypothetical protein CDB3_30280 [Bacillus sp. CDB3]